MLDHLGIFSSSASFMELNVRDFDESTAGNMAPRRIILASSCAPIIITQDM